MGFIPQSVGGKRHSTALTVIILSSLSLSACSSESDADSNSSADNNGNASQGVTQSLPEVPEDEEAIGLLPPELQEGGELTNGVNAAQPPLEYIDDDGEIVGFDVDLIDAIGQALNLTIETEDASFESLIPGVDSGKYDLAASGFGDNLQRQEEVDFVDYFSSGTSILVEAGNPDSLDLHDLCGETVALVEGSQMQELAVPELNEECDDRGEPDLEVTALKDSSDPTTSLLSGRASAAMIPAFQAAYAEDQQPEMFEVAPGGQVAESYMGIAFSKDSEIIQAVYTALINMKNNGVYDELLENWNLEALEVDEIIINGATE